jgi:hypothetical protein
LRDKSRRVFCQLQLNLPPSSTWVNEEIRHVVMGVPPRPLPRGEFGCGSGDLLYRSPRTRQLVLTPQQRLPAVIQAYPGGPLQASLLALPRNSVQGSHPRTIRQIPQQGPLGIVRRRVRPSPENHRSALVRRRGTLRLILEVAETAMGIYPYSQRAACPLDSGAGPSLTQHLEQGHDYFVFVSS